MTSRPPISPGASGARAASRRLSGLSRGRSATAPLPRPGGGRSVRAAEGGTPGDHRVSVAMPDSPANSAAGIDRETDHTLASAPVRVMLPLPLPEPLDYLTPDGAAAPEPG